MLQLRERGDVGHRSDAARIDEVSAERAGDRLGRRDVDALERPIDGEAAGGKKTPLPGAAGKAVTERPDKK